MSADADLRFLRQLQRLLAEGLFTSTYKFALLQALADVAVEREAGPDGSLWLGVSDIAEKFIEYYWRQALPYSLPAGGLDPIAAMPGDRDLTLLVQNTDRQAAVITLVAHARSRHGSLAAARQNSRSWTALRGQVARVIRVMPLWKLQTIARESAEFLYRKAEFRDDHIRLLPGVPAALRSFHGLVTHLVRGAWVDQVQRIPQNRALLGEAPNLADFLFGSDRAGLAAFGEILREHQSRQCFYCGRCVTGAGAVDHFIPWSRYPVDLGHNFVYTHRDCNRDKRDYLAHPEHLSRWREQNLDAGEPLSARFTAARLPHDRDRSRRIALWAYGQGELAGAHVWVRGNQVDPLPPDWGRVLTGRGLRIAAEDPAPYG